MLELHAVKDTNIKIEQQQPKWSTTKKNEIKT